MGVALVANALNKEEYDNTGNITANCTLQTKQSIFIPEKWVFHAGGKVFKIRLAHRVAVIIIAKQLHAAFMLQLYWTKVS